MVMTVGVLGATSPVGAQVLRQLLNDKVSVIAFSRGTVSSTEPGIDWVSLADCDLDALKAKYGPINHWISASHIWVLNQHFQMMQELGTSKVVCLSSTSQFTKTSSSTLAEEQTVQRLIDGEQQLRDWAVANHIAWTVLRPTLIYGRGNDRNLSEMVKIIDKFRFFPIFGTAQGLRQPVYVDDVASACVQALYSDKASNKAYNISGAEQLSYQEMVKRVFVAMGLKPRLLRINLAVFNVALFFLHLIPRYKGWNADMVLRMNRDMVFDHHQATEDFGFSPQVFTLTDKDVGKVLLPSQP